MIFSHLKKPFLKATRELCSIVTLSVKQDFTTRLRICKEPWDILLKVIFICSVRKKQKQPSIGVITRRCSENMHQIYRRTSMPKCDFKKVAKSNFIEITLRLGCSPVNLLHLFKTSFPKNTSGWLLLKKRILFFLFLLLYLELNFTSSLAYGSSFCPT